MNDKSLIPGRGRTPFAYAREDIPAGAVVFLVALPLCLGVATASGANPLAGMIAGVLGGLIVPLISRSSLSVSGPAAGLAAIVASAISEVGYGPFLLSVLLAGLIQIALGALRLGLIAHFLPSAAISGMLSAIGLLIILKQLPHAVGYDHDFEGDEAFAEPDGHNTLSALVDALGALTPGAMAVTASGFALAFLWPYAQRALPKLRLVPLPLMIVALGTLVASVLDGNASLRLSQEHLVNLPQVKTVSDLGALFTFPDFSAIGSGRIYYHAMTLALVASLETLLSLEAIDGLDPHRRISPPNRELVAQGVANTMSGLVGGLPITSVIVRSSANAHAGGKTRLSTFVHGFLLLMGLLLLSPFLNRIPLSALAVVLILVGWKLSSPKIWKDMWHVGPSQFIPFVVTIVAILSTDLLRGTLLGAAVGLFFSVRAQQKNALLVTKDKSSYLITFLKDMTFLQGPALKETLRQVPDGAYVAIDQRRVAFIDHDIQTLITNFSRESLARDITLDVVLPAGQGSPPPAN